MATFSFKMPLYGQKLGERDFVFVEDDLFFIITNTILSFPQDTFTSFDIIQKIMQEYPPTRHDMRLPRFCALTFERLKESGKIIEEGRYFIKTKGDGLVSTEPHGFFVSDGDWKKIAEWQDKHLEEAHNCKTIQEKASVAGAIGGAFTFSFTPTTIGTVSVCRCGLCGEEYDFSLL